MIYALTKRHSCQSSLLKLFEVKCENGVSIILSNC
jgi:hypothetical protein